jgi:hypothetical protein
MDDMAANAMRHRDAEWVAALCDSFLGRCIRPQPEIGLHRCGLLLRPYIDDAVGIIDDSMPTMR